MTLFVHAPNVHLGGGRTLLRELLRSLKERPDICVIVDERLDLPDGFPESAVGFRAAPTLLGRLNAERFLRRSAGPADHVLCFGNLPPLFNVPARVAVFIQNLYLVDNRSLESFPPGVRWRLHVERLWLRARVKKAQVVVVQTPSVQREVEASFGCKAVVAAFHAPPEPAARTEADKLYDFIYIGSGEPHKNHRTLIDAWVELARSGHRPRLCLTLSRARYPALVEYVDRAKSAHGLRIENVDAEASPPPLAELYAQSGALIFPSLFESFGLPLVEARAAGLPILAAEADYVRDLVDPAQTFDPHSPLSIARAVRRYLGVPRGKPGVGTPAEFLAEVESRLARRA